MITRATLVAADPDNGKPLSFGKVYTYAPGTTTHKATYLSLNGANEASNPIILSALGACELFLDGRYDLAVYDSNDELIQTFADVYGVVSEDQIIDLVTTSIATTALGYGRLQVDEDTTLDTSAAAKIIEIDATAGDVTLTLPSAASMIAKPPITIVRVDSTTNTVLVDGSGSEFVDGGATVTLQPKIGAVPGSAITIRSNGFAWYSTAPAEVRFNPRIIIPSTTGSANAYTAGSAQLVPGETRSFRATFANTGAATLNGATIKKINGSNAKADLAEGDIAVGDVVLATYDGTDWVLVSSHHLYRAAVAAVPTAWPFEYIGEFDTITSGGINITDLGGYRDIAVVGLDIVSSASGVRTLRVSDDNGVSFLSTSIYRRTGTTSAQSAMELDDGSSTNRNFEAEILGFNTTDPIKRTRSVRTGDNAYVAIASPLAFNAIRISNAAQTITSGVVHLWARS